MKRVILCAAVCLLVLCGCSSEPSDLNTVGEDSFNKGYQDGYAAAFEESLDAKEDAPSDDEELLFRLKKLGGSHG